jgi:hypothetical protein
LSGGGRFENKGFEDKQAQMMDFNNAPENFARK